MSSEQLSINDYILHALRFLNGPYLIMYEGKLSLKILNNLAYFKVQSEENDVNNDGNIQRRRKIRLKECNAKCRYLKKLTCKGTLRQVFFLFEVPYTHPP